MLIYTLTKDALTIFLSGKPYQVNSTHQNFDRLMRIVKGEEDTPSESEIKQLVSLRETIQVAINQSGNSRVRLGANEIIIDGIPVHSYSTDRILAMMKQGINVDPWIRFMERLIENPSRHVFNELMEWMTKGNMPVTEDGHFLAYKKVDDNLQSYHSSPDGTHLQHVVGESVSMPRYQVDDVRHNTCSTGLHFCSWDYLPSYYGQQGKVLVLKIDPAEVVTIPSDYQHTKGRAEGYQVLLVLNDEDVRFAFENNSHPYEGEFYYEDEDEGDDNTDLDISQPPHGAQVRCTYSYFDDGTFTEGKVYTVFQGQVWTDDESWDNGSFAEFELVSNEPVYQACKKIAKPGAFVFCVSVSDGDAPYQAGDTYQLDEKSNPLNGWDGSLGAWIVLRP